MNRVLFSLAAGLACWTPPNAMAAAEGVVLVRDHHPASVIVVDRNAAPQVKRAATTLQEYIEKSTGARLPIQETPEGNAAIYIGRTPEGSPLETDRKTLDEDGFIASGAGPGTYFIVGGSDWGTEFGVYDFLERSLGIRWLMPTAVGEEVPPHASLVVSPSRIRSEPAYLSREFSPMRNLEAADADSVWARFNRARGRIAFHHNMPQLFPVGKFGASHPEFYPELKGKRFIPPDGKSFQWQPNFSAPGIVEAAAGEIETYFQNHPEAASYSLGVNDLSFFDSSAASKARRSGTKNYLELEDVSNDYFDWANAVVKTVLKTYPDKWFGLLAYNNVAEPPSNGPLNPRLVPFITYERMRWENPELRGFGEDLTRRWAKAASSIGWYDYAYGAPYLLPRVWFHRMADSLQWGAAHGVRFHYAELYPNWGEGPKAWVFAKLLWNPGRNVDSLLGEWYEAAVGPGAAPKLREFYAIWEDFWTAGIAKSNWNRKSGQYLPFLDLRYLLDVPNATLDRCDALMDETARLADSPQRKARAAELQKMWRFYKLSVIAFQGDNLWRSLDLQTEQDALAFIEKGEEIIRQSQRRLELFRSFQQEPLDASVFRVIDKKYSEIRGDRWGNSLLWCVVPWVSQSKAVKARLEQAAEKGNPALRGIALQVLSAASGHATALLKNPSFEDGLANWVARSNGRVAVSNENAKTGSHSLRVAGRGESSISQAIDYRPGTYYASMECRVSEARGDETITLALHTIDESGRVRGGVLPEGKAVLPPGSRRTLVVPFELTASNVPRGVKARLRVSALLSAAGSNSVIYLDDINVFALNSEKDAARLTPEARAQ